MPQVERDRGAPPETPDGAAVVVAPDAAALGALVQLSRMAEHLQQCRAACHDGCGAGEGLAEAISLAEAAADRVRELIFSQASGVRPAPAEESELLTARELEVAALICRGMSNRRIGSELFVSESTVKFHVHNLLRKLGVRTRAEIAYEASRAALPPPGSAVVPAPRAQKIWS